MRLPMHHLMTAVAASAAAMASSSGIDPSTAMHLMFNGAANHTRCTLLLLRGGTAASASTAENPTSGPTNHPTAGGSPGMRRRKRRSVQGKKMKSTSTTTSSVGGGNGPGVVTSGQVDDVCNNNKDDSISENTNGVEQLGNNGPATATGTSSSTGGPTVQRQEETDCMKPFLAGTTPWVRLYLASVSDDPLMPIPREFLSDGFNLQGLQVEVERVGRLKASQEQLGNMESCVDQMYNERRAGSTTTQSKPSFPYYRAALKMILGKENELEQILKSNDEGGPNRAGVDAAAVALFTLVHARFAVSPRGLDTLRRVMRKPPSVAGANSIRKEEGSSVNAIFGKCPRLGCNGMALLPIGMSDEYDFGDSVDSRTMGYCCSCGEMLRNFQSKVDGSAWGTTLCHLFLMTHGGIFSEIREVENIVGKRKIGDAAITDENGRSNHPFGGERPVPQIFGFPVHESLAQIKYPLLQYKKSQRFIADRYK